MSTFPGIVEDIPGISVDRFDSDNLQSSAFFLSHCHFDHMEGLNQSFFSRLVEKNQFLYCTSLSKLFLEGRFNLDRSQSDNIKVVVPCSPIIVEYLTNDRQESIAVTSVNAGHCPGSVMFIFERNNISILYTGDFRIDPKDLRRLKPLHDQVGAIMVAKKYKKIYLDTTFLSDDFKHFPSRRESLSAISRVAGEWLAQDQRNVVILECSALIGSEFLYMELRDSLKNRVHVKSRVYHDFSRIPELERCITSDGNSTPIHACMEKRDKGFLTCRKVCPEHILTIVPSALRWKGRNLTATISEWDPHVQRRFYVCLSMHSSFDELKAFIEYFQAERFVACVQPPGCKDIIQDRLNEMTRKAVINEVSLPKTYTLKAFKTENSTRAKFQSQYFSDDSSD